MEIILEAILSYLMGLAGNLRTDAIVTGREEKLNEQLKREDSLRKAIASSRSLRDELRGACTELARSRDRIGVTQKEEPLWRLLTDDNFQTDLTQWLMTGGIEEGNEVKQRLVDSMEGALAKSTASAEQIEFLKTSYFDALDKTVFSNPILAHWRHQLSLDFLREQVALLRRHAEEAAGIYSSARQKRALDHYCEKALVAWDIIDLSNLPEGDIHMATQKLLLRQLYMPLRIEVEPISNGEVDDAALARLEAQREARRHREAGHFMADESSRNDLEVQRTSVGERLAASRRLVVLGDPGGGKTTMLRWMATAYLLQHNGDPAFTQIPDTQTLPSNAWIPVLIRCRDLGDTDLCRCFPDFLTQHLNKTELLPEEAEVMRAVILDRIAKGEALLLVDGLDEITNPRVRMMFCQELERTATRYPNAAIVVTSRIVGYRDMPYRMGSGFEHGQIAELSGEDKDLFARRWVEVTEQHQSADEKAKRAQELLEALHSSDRIERLTGNPMLLTTLALVKRKVGKLPNKRTKLYAEAVSVLLNWNPRLYQTIEEDEAMPQLEYLAYEMCRRGVQRLTDDEILDLLETLRGEYPNIRAVRQREPRAFLALLEARSSILIKSGGIWQKNKTQEKAIWEFRHLTFQEYLAARAILDGRYPGRDKHKSLAEQVAPLAGAVKKLEGRRLGISSDAELDLPESWREALRLLVADCKDDDVDDVLLSIMNPMAGEDTTNTARPRAVLAALCLANEPNIDDQTAEQVIAAFVEAIMVGDGSGFRHTSADKAAIELGASFWSPILKRYLVEDYCRCPPKERSALGGLCGMTEIAGWDRPNVERSEKIADLVSRLGSGDRIEVISAALTTMAAAFEQKVPKVEGLVENLFSLLIKDGPECHAAAWALVWLSGGWADRPSNAAWLPSEPELETLIAVLTGAPKNEGDTRRYLIHILGKAPQKRSLEAIISQLDGADPTVCKDAISVLAKIGNKRAVAPLLAVMDDHNASVRVEAIGALGSLGDKLAVAPLLAVMADDQDPTVRIAAIGALEKLGDKLAVAPLLAVMDDDQDANIRIAAISALAKLDDKLAVAPLLAIIDNEASNIRIAAIGALKELGDKQAVAPLLALIHNEDANVRVAAINALGTLGGQEANATLLALMHDQNTGVAVAAIDALAHLGERHAAEPLVEKLNHQNTLILTAAIRALGKLDHKLAAEPILAKLNHEDARVRIAAIRALMQLDCKQAIAPLKVLKDDLNADVSKAAGAALVQMGENQPA